MLGSAGMAAFMTSRISAEMPPLPTRCGAWRGLGDPAARHSCTNRSPRRCRSRLLLPAFFALFGVVAAMFLLGFGDSELLVEDDDLDRRGPQRRLRGRIRRRRDVRRRRRVPRVHGVMGRRARTGDAGRAGRAGPSHRARPTTTVSPSRCGRAPTTCCTHPAEAWHAVRRSSRGTSARGRAAVEPEPPARLSRRANRGARILDELLSDLPSPSPKVEPIGFAHNGFTSTRNNGSSRCRRPPQNDGEAVAPTNAPARHSIRPRNNPRSGRSGSSPTAGIPATDPDDASSYGRHSMPGRD